MNYFISQILLYHLTQALDFCWLDSQFNIGDSHNTIRHVNIVIIFWLSCGIFNFSILFLFCLLPLVLLLSKTLYYYTFFIWLFLLSRTLRSFIPETCRTHWMIYLCIYWKHTTITYVVYIILSYNFTIRYFIYIFRKICSKERFVYHNLFDYCVQRLYTCQVWNV